MPSPDGNVGSHTRPRTPTTTHRPSGSEQQAANRRAAWRHSQAGRSATRSRQQGTLRLSSLIGLFMAGGFSAQQARIMAAISMRESGGNPNAYNPNAGTGDNSYGLVQINMLGSMGPARRKLFGITNNRQLLDPLTTARAAYKLYQQAGFQPWLSYRGGIGLDSLAYLPQARRAPITSWTTGSTLGGGTAQGGFQHSAAFYANQAQQTGAMGAGPQAFSTTVPLNLSQLGPVGAALQNQRFTDPVARYGGQGPTGNSLLDKTKVLGNYGAEGAGLADGSPQLMRESYGQPPDASAADTSTLNVSYDPTTGLSVSAGTGGGTTPVQTGINGIHLANTAAIGGVHGGRSSFSDHRASGSYSFRQQLVKTAMRAIGTPYKNHVTEVPHGGGVGLGFDCASLVNWIFKSHGIHTGIVASMIAGDKRAYRTSLKNMQPGDIVYWPGKHVAMYIGNGKIIEAAHHGTNVRIRRLGGGGNAGWDSQAVAYAFNFGGR